MGIRETEQVVVVGRGLRAAEVAGHPFYVRLNALLDTHDFDRFVEGQCRRFYAKVMGRPSLTPGRYFRLLLVGYFEGHRFGTWDRVARDRLARDPQISAAARRGAAAGSFDDFPDAAPDRSGDAPRCFHVGATTTRRSGVAHGEDDRDRRHHARGERGDAEYRAARHRGELSSLFDGTREDVWDRDADPRGLGTARSETKEEDLE